MVLLYQRGRLFVKEALQNGGDLRSCCVSLWLQFGVGDAGDQSLGDGPGHGFCCLPSGSSGLAALRFAS